MGKALKQSKPLIHILFLLFTWNKEEIQAQYLL